MRIGRHALARPLIGRGREGVVKGLLRRVEAAQKADQRRQDAPRVGAVRRLQSVARVARAHSFGRGLLKSTSGRTSMKPSLASGIPAPMRTASLRSRASITRKPPSTSLGLHERTVGRRHLPVAHLHGHGLIGELEGSVRHQVAAFAQLPVVGPGVAESGLGLLALIEDFLRIEVD